MNDSAAQPSQPILTLMEVAKKLRLSRKTTTDLLNSGRIPGARMGKKWRVLDADVDAVLRGQHGQSSGTEETRPAA